MLFKRMFKTALVFPKVFNNFCYNPIQEEYRNSKILLVHNTQQPTDQNEIMVFKFS